MGPGSGSGATVGGGRCEVTGPRCVHAAPACPRRLRARSSGGGPAFMSSCQAMTGVSAAGVGFGHACLLRGQGQDGRSLFCARFACACGRVSAPARFAHLIARARRRTHLARRFPPGLFSGPCRSLSAETPKGGPGSRLSLLSSSTIPPNVKPLQEQKMKMPEIFHGMPAAEAGGDRGDGWTVRRRRASRRAPHLSPCR